VNCFSFACDTERFINGVPVATCHCALGESPAGQPVRPQTAFLSQAGQGNRDFCHKHPCSWDDLASVTHARRVNGKSAPYAEQLFFAGLASLSFLPATAAPIDLTEEGLPVGLQIIGPEDEDPTTIEFARLLEAEIGGFVPPPAYR
jgi:hypothetical protein